MSDWKQGDQRPQRPQVGHSIMVFDLDGTLCDDRHRAHHIEYPPKDMDAYNAELGYDPPVPGVVELAIMAQNADHLGVLSGRDDKWLGPTRDWLRKQGLFPDYIQLRPPAFSGISNPEYKVAMLADLAERIPVRVVVDDHPGVKRLVEAELKIPVVTVAGVRDHTKGGQ